MPVKDHLNPLHGNLSKKIGSNQEKEQSSKESLTIQSFAMGSQRETCAVSGYQVEQSIPVSKRSANQFTNQNLNLGKINGKLQF